MTNQSSSNLTANSKSGGADGQFDESLDLPSFHAISIHAGLHAKVKVGPEQSVRIQAHDPEIANQIDFSVFDGELTITRRGNFFDALLSGEIIAYLRQFGQKVTIEIEVPELDEAIASSGARAVVDRMAGPLVCLRATSGGHLKVADMDATRLELDATSGGSLKLSGDCDRAEAHFSSGGSISGNDLHSTDLEVAGSSGGSARLTASGTVSGHVSSGASLHVGGRPDQVHVDTDSGGSVLTR